MAVPDEVIERFLGTGRLPRAWADWSGTPAERRREGEAAAREVLGRIVRWRAKSAPLSVGEAPTDVAGRVRERAEPMVRGLLGAEAPVVLECLSGCVRVVTPASFRELAADLSPRTAWDLANLLLDAMGAPTLADDIPELEGISHAAVGYVLPAAFTPGPRTDVLVHEVAHLLHAVPRARAGLSPGREPLFRVDLRHRETFAWACELWTCFSREPDPAAAAVRSAADADPVDVRVDRALLSRCLCDAAAGAGWAAIAGLGGAR